MEIMQYVVSWSLLHNWLLSNRNSAIKPYKLCFHLFRLGIWEEDALQAGYRISIAVCLFIFFPFLPLIFKVREREYSVRTEWRFGIHACWCICRQ